MDRPTLTRFLVSRSEIIERLKKRLPWEILTTLHFWWQDGDDPPDPSIVEVWKSIPEDASGPIVDELVESANSHKMSREWLHGFLMCTEEGDPDYDDSE